MMIENKVEVLRYVLLFLLLIVMAIGWSFHSNNRPVELDIVMLGLLIAWIAAGFLKSVLRRYNLTSHYK